MLPQPTWAATFVVNSTLDTVDDIHGDGVCDDGAGNCTLRAALEETNALAGSHTINFSIAGGGVKTISPATLLPAITRTNVTIDGTTQPGSSCGDLWLGTPRTLNIVIDGGGTISYGLQTTGTFSTFRGLQVQAMDNTGIDVQAADAIVECNTLVDNSEGTRIQTSNRTVVSGNLTSGNASYGIFVQDSDAVIVTGNFSGTDAAGATAVANGYGLQLAGATNTIVGGTTAAEANLFSGNTSGGIEIRESFHTADPSVGNVIQGNLIGTDRTGTAALGNATGGNGSGIVDNGTNTTIGGTAAGTRNVISGHSTATTNSGLQIAGSGTVVQGNYIGTNGSGTAALGNGLGILVVSGGSTIGGTTAGARNVISGNSTGVLILDHGASPANNVIQGNFIGVAADGATALGNTNYGIAILGAGSANNVIGGTAANAGNIIAHNTNGGVTTRDFLGIAGASGIGQAILGNSIYANGGLGIDLTTAVSPAASDGVTSNDTLDVDTGPNNFQNFPVISAATTTSGGTSATGTLNSLASTTYRLEFFANATADDSGHGEGQTYLGATAVTTDGSGNASFTAAGLTATTLGYAITATASQDLGGGNFSTSEFSATLVASAPPSSSDPGRSGGGTTFPPGFLTGPPSPQLPALPPPSPAAEVFDPSVLAGPVIRDLALERLAITTYVGLFRRLPSTSIDWTAVNHFAYGDRIERDLEAERVGLVSFTHRFARLPQAAADWLIVHVLGFLAAA